MNTAASHNAQAISPITSVFAPVYRIAISLDDTDHLGEFSGTDLIEF